MFVPVRSTKFWKAYYIKMWVCAYMFCVAENTGWFQFVKTWPLSLLFWPSACWTQQIYCNVAKKKSEKGKKNSSFWSLEFVLYLEYTLSLLTKQLLVYNQWDHLATCLSFLPYFGVHGQTITCGKCVGSEMAEMGEKKSSTSFQLSWNI